ncbi:RtcB family protein [Luteimonas endophytica]|uniref:RtcB family protein n=1 Tax=Luteimonas endophytica TaxID=3042023 RepID=UPI003CE5AF3F
MAELHIREWPCSNLMSLLIRCWDTGQYFRMRLACRTWMTPEAHAGREMLMTRKDAVRAGRGEPGIVPGSMGAKSFIGRGLGKGEDSTAAATAPAGR